jgi:hypothetical protein
MKQVNYKYRILEAKSIIKNKENYGKKVIQKAQQLLDTYTPSTYTPLTEEQRAEIKRKYPNTYK